MMLWDCFLRRVMFAQVEAEVSAPVYFDSDCRGGDYGSAGGQARKGSQAILVR